MIDEDLVNYYKVLGGKRSDSFAEIRRLYLVRVEEVHPDKGGSVKEFQALQESYVVLRDPGLRHSYDSRLTLLRPPCSACRGSGEVRRQMGFANVIKERCINCEGSGVINGDV